MANTCCPYPTAAQLLWCRSSCISYLQQQVFLPVSELKSQRVWSFVHKPNHTLNNVAMKFFVCGKVLAKGERAWFRERRGS